MVRFKNRYIAVEINPTNAVSMTPFKLEQNALTKAIYKKVQQMHGDFGVAAIRAGFHAKYCNDTTRIAVVRVRHGPHRLVSSVLPFVTKLNKNAVVLRTLYTGATIKHCFRFIIGYQNSKLIETLGVLKSDEEKEAFRRALLNVKFMT